MKKRYLAALWLACLALTGSAARTLEAAKYPPGLRWREIERNGITVIFPAERSAEAMAALVAAEASNAELAAFWRFRLPGRVRIVLSDSTDQPNGFATFFPFNLVGADLAEPAPDSELASRSGSMNLVLAHELTHLFTMNAGSPPFRSARRLFGSLPLLYPAAQMPPWAVEGLAVEGESRFTGDGRLNHPPYRLMLSAARRDGLFPGWQEISGLPTDWPGPAGKYLFGAGFMEYLAAKCGTGSLRNYVERIAGQLVLLGNNRDFIKVFGAPLSTLWDEYRTERTAAQTGPAPEALTDGGFLHQYPCPLPGGRLVYFHRDYRGRGAIELLEPGKRRGKTLVKMDEVDGLDGAASGDRVYISATDRFHAFNDFSDLYEYDLKHGRLRRLSRGQRLMQPAKKENSSCLYCVQRRDGRYYLARFDLQTRQVQVLSRSFAGMAQPAISPDGAMIAAAVKPAHQPWGIALFSSSGQLLAFRTFGKSNLHQPRWQDNRTILFILEKGETTALASFSLGGDKNGIYQDPHLDGLQQFALGQDGREIFFTYYSGRGQEIARQSIADLALVPAEITVASEISESEPPAAPPGRPYRFWRDLMPRWWAPAWRFGGDEFQAGIITSGQDALGIHNYSIEGYYGFSSRRLSVSFSYTYDGLFPTLAFSYSDNSDFFRGIAYNHSLRSQELQLVSLWPLHIRRRSQMYFYADLHLEKQTTIYSDDSRYSPGNTNGFRLGIDFNSSRQYYDSVSPSDGVQFALRYSIQPDGLGNNHSSHSVQADLRHYIPIFRPGVLAWRLAGTRGWDTDSWLYTMGGLGLSTGLGGGQPFRLMRGFPSGYQWGDRGWLFNLEYRLPLFKIEKAVLPALSLDRLYLNLFFDMGHLGSREIWFPTVYSVGGEAVLRLAFGGVTFSDLSFGAALGFGPAHSWSIYLRTGRSF